MANRLDFFLENREEWLREAGKSMAIEKVVRSSLPGELGKLCSAGRLEQGRLALYADNGAAAAKIRQLSQSILGKLQSRGLEVDTLKVLVRVNPQRKPVVRVKAGMGKKGIESFRELAETMENSPLKSSIRSLLERLDDEKNPLDDIKDPENG